MWSDVLRQLSGLTLIDRNVQEEIFGVPAKVQTGHTPSKVTDVGVSLLGEMCDMIVGFEIQAKIIISSPLVRR